MRSNTFDKPPVAQIKALIWRNIFEHLGYDYLVFQEEFKQAVHFYGTLIHPDFGKMGLGLTLVQSNLKLIEEDKTRFVPDAVHPENNSSLKVCIG